MSVSIPQPFRATVQGPIGPVTVDGIPNDFDISIEKLPKITIGVDPLSVDITHLPKITVGLDPVTIKPVDVNLAITRIPDVRTHLPADFTIGMKVLGLELLALRVTGEAQVITEPYTPNPCEETEPAPARPVLTALPPENG